MSYLSRTLETCPPTPCSAAVNIFITTDTDAVIQSGASEKQAVEAREGCYEHTKVTLFSIKMINLVYSLR